MPLVMEASTPPTPQLPQLPQHTHDLIFNDDGYEVCRVCGICTQLREMRYDSSVHEASSNNIRYSEILYNNHIGFVKEIEEEYKNLKFKIKRGYSNKILYAYCSYIVLMRNSIFYTLTQISQMFQINNFQKCVCMIEKKYYDDKSNLIVDNVSHLRSSIDIFLSQNMKIKFRKRAFQIAEILYKRNPYEKPEFLISIILYITLYSNYSRKNDLIVLLCDYFSINKRTLNKKIKKIVQIKV